MGFRSNVIFSRANLIGWFNCFLTIAFSSPNIKEEIPPHFKLPQCSNFRTTQDTSIYLVSYGILCICDVQLS